MTTPAISVVIPVYNAARYLTSAIASVQTQTCSDFEIVAVDDGSTDNSKQLLERIAATDSRVRIISRPNTGIVGALNDGLAAARGEFVARMDADDLSLPTRFEKQLAFLRAHPDVVCVGTAFNYIDAKGALLKWNPRQTEHAAIEQALLSGDGGALIHPSIFLRRDAVERAGRYRERAQWIEDFDLYLRLALIGHLANLPEVLLHYRYHQQSVNFTRNQGRIERKIAILAEAHSARGLPFDRTKFTPPDYKATISTDNLRDFAISSLRFANPVTPWRYALRAVRLSPRDRRSWKTLSYVAKASLGIVPRIQ